MCFLVVQNYLAYRYPADRAGRRTRCHVGVLCNPFLTLLCYRCSKHQFPGQPVKRAKGEKREAKCMFPQEKEKHKGQSQKFVNANREPVRGGAFEVRSPKVTGGCSVTCLGCDMVRNISGRPSEGRLGDHQRDVLD